MPNIMIRASAGSGKTFQLTNRYLGLLAEGVSPEKILAVTFTRKAAGEILDRILGRLADAALTEAKAADLAQFLPRPLTQADCLGLLAQLLHKLPLLRVATLDSFFSRLATALALELGLPANWTILEPAAEASFRMRALQQVLAEEPDNVRTLLGQLHHGESSRSVSEELTTIVGDLYVLYLTAPRQAWHQLALVPGLTAAELASSIAAHAHLQPPRNRNGTPNLNWQKALVKTRANLVAEDWDGFLAHTLTVKVLNGEDAYSGVTIAQEVRTVFDQLLKHGKALITERVAKKTAALEQLLKLYADRYEPLKLSAGNLLFSDVTRVLAKAGIARNEEQVGFRLDTPVQHVLLDEFQDTSLHQWEVLHPLAQRVARDSATSSFFCVGDPKQAIYGWRGGVAELFEAVQEQLPNVQPEYLAQSYRSSPVIIELVNRLFTNMQANPALDENLGVARHWDNNFREHSAAKTQLPGYVKIRVAPKKRRGQKLETLRVAIEEIVEVAQASPGRSIAVLTRSNDMVARTIFELRQRGVEASEEGGSKLTDSPAVLLLLSLCRLADHPTDTIAAFHLATSPLAEGLMLNRDNYARRGPLLAAELRQQLLHEGYGGTIGFWAASLRAVCAARDRARLDKMVEAAYLYDPEADLRPIRFLDYIQARKVEDARPAQVRVLTIHGSKGLEFDIVFLPELHGSFSPKGAVISGSENPLMPPETVFASVKQNLQPLLPESYQRCWQQNRDRAAAEALCVLYVAITRAAHALYIYLPPASKPAKTLAGLVHGALLREELPEDTTPLQMGDAAWATAGAEASPEKQVPRAQEKAPAALEPTVLPALELGRRRRHLARNSPSKMEGQNLGTLEKRLVFTFASATGARRGTVIHEWFQQIEWLENGVPDQEGLRQTEAARPLPDAEVTELLQSFQRLLGQPGVQAVLSREEYTKLIAARWGSGPWDLRVQRERRFAARRGDVLIVGAIDRLVLGYAAGELRFAEVLDYKTDAVEAGNEQGLQASVDFYQPQMASYREVVTRLFGLPAAQVGGRLIFTTPDVIREV